MVRSAKAEAINNALPEGGDIPDREEAHVPLSLDRLFFRLDEVLRLSDKALVAVEQPRSSPLDPAAYWTYEVELFDGGKVRLCDMVSRGRKLGVIQDCETVIENSWSSSPVPR
jgi:hypothetical protein